MKEGQLIQNLSQNLKPFKSADNLNTYLLKWMGYSLVILILAYFSLPIRHDFMTEIETIRYNVENILWFFASLSSGVAFYFSCFPQKMKSTLWIPATLSITLLFLIILTGINPQNMHQEFEQEMSLWRGRCGFITFFVSMIHSGFLGHWASKAAPRDAGEAGFWAALSGSAMGCLFMQFVCAHHNTLHLMLWHFMPLVVICYLGQRLGKSLLRW
jgi:hypothetical protein